MRYQCAYGAEDEDARFYAPICVVKSVCEEVRLHVPSEREEEEEEEEGFSADIAAIKKGERKSKQSLSVSLSAYTPIFHTEYVTDPILLPNAHTDTHSRMMFEMATQMLNAAELYSSRHPYLGGVLILGHPHRAQTLPSRLRSRGNFGDVVWKQQHIIEAKQNTSRIMCGV